MFRQERFLGARFGTCVARCALMLGLVAGAAEAQLSQRLEDASRALENTLARAELTEDERRRVEAAQRDFGTRSIELADVLKSVHAGARGRKTTRWLDRRACPRRRRAAPGSSWPR